MAPGLSKDESRAVAFIGLLLAVSAAARLMARPSPIEASLPAVDIAALEAASRRQQVLDTKLGPGEKLDPNTAPAEQIARLPGASRTVAERVVAERAVRPFRSAADLERVSGVGPATIEKWRTYLTLPATIQSAAPTQARSDGAAADRDGTQAGRTTGPLDLNVASAAELERLPGIGPVLAARIVAYRDSVGGFSAIDQLQQVKGVGPAMMRRLAPMVRTGR